MKASEIKELLADRYCQPEWALAFEVANKTGRASGYADAIAMSMYPSRGLELHGFEIKVSRGDLATEIKNPNKAEKFAAYCDKWWLVVPKELASKVEAIEAALGFDVTGWVDHRALCAAIRAVHQLRPEDMVTFGSSLAGLEDKAKAIIDITAEFRKLVSSTSQGGEA